MTCRSDAFIKLVFCDGRECFVRLGDIMMIRTQVVKGRWVNEVYYGERRFGEIDNDGATVLETILDPVIRVGKKDETREFGKLPGYETNAFNPYPSNNPVITATFDPSVDILKPPEHNGDLGCAI